MSDGLALVPKVVVLGGGTGSYAVLTGLKKHAVDLTAAVAMTDSGGSSGILRDELGQLPPGDVRQCLVALSPDDHASRILRNLFTYRFDKGEGLNGHSFGNLFLAALAEIAGSADKAIEEAGRLLGIRGRVLPVTLTKTTLHARLADGADVEGEANIDVRTVTPEVPIDYVYLSPPAYGHAPTIEAIEAADAIVIGPGDLYTSLIPTLLVDGIAQAIGASAAVKVYNCNLMTKRGESAGYRLSDFVGEILAYLGPRPHLDYVTVNDAAFPEKILNRYAQQGAYPVELDLEATQRLVPHVIPAPLVSAGSLLRHDAERLASVLLEIVRTERSQRADDLDVLVPAAGAAPTEV